MMAAANLDGAMSRRGGAPKCGHVHRRPGGRMTISELACLAGEDRAEMSRAFKLRRVASPAVIAAVEAGEISDGRRILWAVRGMSHGHQDAMLAAVRAGEFRNLPALRKEIDAGRINLVAADSGAAK